MSYHALVFALNAMYVASVVGKFRVVEVDDAEETRSAPMLDAITVVTLVANGVTAAMKYVGQDPSLQLSALIWFVFFGIALHRLDQDIAAIKARSAKGDQA